jgi:hypothetical protein
MRPPPVISHTPPQFTQPLRRHAFQIFKMQFSTIALLFAATVLGAPAESLTASGLRVRGEIDQGEGFYLAVFNNETGIADVEFTPLAELAAIAPVEEATSAVDERSLLKRSTSCSGRRSINLGQLDDANRQLANNANAQGWYNKGANGWVSNASSIFLLAHFPPRPKLTIPGSPRRGDFILLQLPGQLPYLPAYNRHAHCRHPLLWAGWLWT